MQEAVQYGIYVLMSPFSFLNPLNKRFFFKKSTIFKLVWYEQPLVEADGWKSEASDTILHSPSIWNVALGKL